MNRRSNKILRELILGSRQNVTELVEKYKVQERSIRADIKELNDTLIEYDLPVIQIGSDGEVFFDTDVRVDVHAFEKFICEHTFYTYFLSKQTASEHSGYSGCSLEGTRPGQHRNYMQRNEKEV